MGCQSVVGGVLIADQVCLCVDGRWCPSSARSKEEERAALYGAPAGDEVREVADAKLEREVRGDAEVEDVGAEQASSGVVDVGQHVWQLASALLGSFEIGVEDVLASVG